MQAGCDRANINWCFSTPEERAWRGRLWPDRMESSAFAQQALDGGHAFKEELERIVQAWREWIASGDGWCGEILSDEATRKAKSTLPAMLLDSFCTGGKNHYIRISLGMHTGRRGTYMNYLGNTHSADHEPQIGLKPVTAEGEAMSAGAFADCLL
ncbi:hypothetical protein AcV5_002996 [Taiwanofungus camphoratus]|nr:hypothetical protein AcV5_002996 [Antrodia cinnamomea]